jgi:hypothetical protein
MRLPTQDEQEPQPDEYGEGQEGFGRSKYRLAPRLHRLTGFPSYRIATLNSRRFAFWLHPAPCTASPQTTQRIAGRNGR